MIQIQGIAKRFGDITAVDHVDLEIYKGELFSILGGSGSGKTTLLRMLGGLEQPTSGRILIDGADMTDVPPYRRPAMNCRPFAWRRPLSQPGCVIGLRLRSW